MMRDHPDYPRLRSIIHDLGAMARTFHGTLYRVSDPGYANTRDLLTGEGARKYGGRWNAPGSFSLVYLSMSVEGAMAETVGLAGHYGFDPAARLPVTLVAIDVALDKVLDLTSLPVRNAVGVTLKAMNGCPWRVENMADREALTQALGRAAWAAGFRGIIVPTPLKRTFRHLNVFPQNLGRSGMLRIRRADRLPAPPAGGPA
jgi:RES domain-containing protein